MYFETDVCNYKLITRARIYLHLHDAQLHKAKYTTQHRKKANETKQTMKTVELENANPLFFFSFISSFIKNNNSIGVAWCICNYLLYLLLMCIEIRELGILEFRQT